MVLHLCTWVCLKFAIWSGPSAKTFWRKFAGRMYRDGKICHLMLKFWQAIVEKVQIPRMQQHCTCKMQLRKGLWEYLLRNAPAWINPMHLLNPRPWRLKFFWLLLIAFLKKFNTWGGNLKQVSSSQLTSVTGKKWTVSPCWQRFDGLMRSFDLTQVMTASSAGGSICFSHSSF